MEGALSDSDRDLNCVNLQRNQLYTVDPKALNHVLMNYHIWQKPEVSRYNLTRIIGGGVLVAEADDHRRQVRVCSPRVSC